MRVLVLGNSHIAMLQQAYDNLPRGVSYAFAPVQAYEGERTLLRTFLSAGTVECVVKEKYRQRGFVQGTLDRNDFDVLLVVGPTGGPGDAFRVIAPASFTGSLTDVPDAASVACPVYAPTGISPDNPPISHALTRTICQTAYSSTLDRFLTVASSKLAVIIIPTPPMSERAVIRRFGPAVHNSRTGEAVLEEWNLVAERAVRNYPEVGIIPIPAQALSRGWLLDSYARSSEEAEIHANGNYARLFADAIGKQFDRWKVDRSPTQ